MFREIDYASEETRRTGANLESMYIGGGTPTSLQADSLRRLLKKISGSFDIKALKEFTVEAGRPDTITEEKLYTMKEAGSGQDKHKSSVHERKTLKIIGKIPYGRRYRKGF